jgi:hypothetical protein
MPAPTQQAQVYFRVAYDRALAAASHTQDVQDPTGIAVYDIAASLSGISKGLVELATALHQIYAQQTQNQSLTRSRGNVW